MSIVKRREYSKTLEISLDQLKKLKTIQGNFCKADLTEFNDSKAALIIGGATTLAGWIMLGVTGVANVIGSIAVMVSTTLGHFTPTEQDVVLNMINTGKEGLKKLIDEIEGSSSLNKYTLFKIEFGFFEFENEEGNIIRFVTSDNMPIIAVHTGSGWKY